MSTHKIGPTVLGPGTVRVPVGEEAAEETTPAWSSIAPLDDPVPPAGRQDQYLFGDFND
jgi:hypothetical protein